MLRKIIQDEQPEYLAVAFDMKAPTFRHKMFEGYKIKRRPMPEDLVGQMPAIKEIIGAYNIPIFEKEGFEADDILATIVNKLKGPNLEIYIVTGDKDILQLVDNGVCVYNPYHKETTVYNRDDVRERFGVEPEYIPDVLALAGDDTDNIPGIRGVGEKTAQELMRQFTSLDRLLEHIDEVKKENLRDTLKKSEEQIRLNRKLAVLEKNVPLEVKLEELKLRPPQIDELSRLFKELEFRNLFKELMTQNSQAVMFNFKVIDSKKGFLELFEKIRARKEFAFELYTGVTASDKGRIRGLGLYTFAATKPYPALRIAQDGSKDGERKRTKGHGWSLVTQYQFRTNSGLQPGEIDYGEDGPYIVQLDTGNSPVLLDDLAGLFKNESCLKICCDLKSVKSILDPEGMTIKGAVFDVILAAYLVNPSAPSYALADISLEYLGRFPSSGFMEPEDPALKAGEAAGIIFELHGILLRELETRELLKLYKEVEIPLVDVLFSMEKKGVYLDVEFLNKMSQELNGKIDNLRKEIFHIAGGQFNLDSPKQLREILFVNLRLPIMKKGKTGPSTDEEVLVKLSPMHELPRLILEYRELAKLKSTYVDSLPELVNPETERIHTSFNQAGTETGRLSSSNPNLQNIPIRTEFARQIRRAISSQKREDLLLSADYSQIELRILAHLSGDEALISAFNSELDIHAHTAALIYSVPEEKIDSRMRSVAKTVNFGIIYGMSPFGLAKELGIDVVEADKFIKSYFERYPKVRSYIEAKIEEARTKGYVTTILNRRRFIPGINSSNQGIRQFAERTAINTPVQGSAADVIKLAMLKIHEKISGTKLDAHLILQIHDELLFEFPRDSLKDLIKIVRNEMENVVKLKIPLKTSLKVGHNWLEMELVK